MSNIDQVKSATDIVKIISESVELKQKGNRYEGLCPFHAEKTPSFSVSPDRQTFKCFGCGESGDVISFIQDSRGFTFYEALEYLAAKANITLDKKSNETPEQRSEKEQMYSENKAIIEDQFSKWIKTQKGDTITLDNMTWSRDTFEAFKVYPFPEGYLFDKKSQKLKELGWMSQGKSGPYQTYRNRIVFPIMDNLERFIGVSARKVSTAPDQKISKYINSPASAIYHKDEILFGLFQAKKHIIKADECFLVEGNKDVISLYNAGIQNVVASCGTAFSESQARIIARYTNTVTVMFDGDKPGIESAKKAILLLLQENIQVSVILLDDGKDPDDICKENTSKELSTYLKSIKKDALIWLSTLDYDAKNSQSRLDTIKKTAGLLSLITDDTTKQFYISELSKSANLGTLARQLKSTITATESENNRKKLDSDQMTDVDQWGIYEQFNSYFVPAKAGTYTDISNFVIRPIIMAIDSDNSNRIVELINKKNERVVVNIDSNDFVELQSFKKAVERFGNFIFTGSPENYTRLKSKIYDAMNNCFVLKTLGWHKEGFYAWSNGITIKDSFQPADEFGVVSHNSKKMFIPIACKTGIEIDSSEMEEDDLQLFTYSQSEKNILFNDWINLITQVHGSNGFVAAAFYVAATFRDHIYAQTKCFPHLNLFGPPGTGKSFLAWSLMSMYGSPRRAFNLSGNTHPAFYRKLSQVRNSIVWFDEYNNQVHQQRIQALKDAYDGGAHTKSQGIDGKKTISTPVLSGCIISGQEQPTADIALFERCISLKFFETEKSRESATLLKNMEKSGIFSKITAQLISARSVFETNFNTNYEEIYKQFLKMYKSDPDPEFKLKERFLVNYAIVVASWTSLSSAFKTDLKLSDLIDTCYKHLADQHLETMSENESTVFWDIVAYLIATGSLNYRQDYIYEKVDRQGYEINRKYQVKHYSEPTTLLYLSPTKVFAEYMEHHRRKFNRPGLSKSALLHYLKNTPAWEGQSRVSMSDTKRFVYVFALKKLDIEIYANSSPQEAYKPAADF